VGSAPTGVLSLLDRLHDAAAQRGGSLLEIRLMQALAHHAGGDADTALTILSGAVLATPEPETHVRLFLEEGAPMLDLLRHATQAGGTAEQRQAQHGDAAEEDHRGLLRAWARQLLERTGPAGEEQGLEQPADLLAGPLSQREIEVLRLLDSDLSGPQIAGELYVSLNTLRTHTKRIFTKLDVTSRAAAVRTAHERGLI
jgi:LuxR family maltose regulon positive regulatory protein